MNIRLPPKPAAARLPSSRDFGELSRAAQAEGSSPQAETPFRRGRGGSSRTLWAASALFVLAAALAPAAERASAVPAGLPEEEFLYDLQFLWFTKVAKGAIRFRRTGENRYRAELMAETRGFVGFLTSFQKNHYVSEMEYVPERRRLLSRRFIKTVSRAGVVTHTTAVIDYARGEVRWRTSRGGQLRDEGADPIPEGIVYEDMLSAFYNLRLGAYGPMTRGRHLTVPALPDYEPTNGEGENPRKASDRSAELAAGRRFDIRIADAATEREYRRRFGRTQEAGLLALVKVPKDLFGQETGEIRVWIDPDFIPVAGTVERAIFLGDVSGTLRKAFVNGRPRVLTVTLRPKAATRPTGTEEEIRAAEGD